MSVGVQSTGQRDIDIFCRLCEVIKKRDWYQARHQQIKLRIHLMCAIDIVAFSRSIVEALKTSTLSQSTTTSRRRCAAWYQEQSITDQSLKTPDENHEHFNSVLDGLLEVLVLRSVESSHERLALLFR